MHARRESALVVNDEARAYIAAQPESAKPLWERPLEDLRRVHREDALANSGEPEPVVSVEDLDAGGVPARLYRPRGGEAEALVWLHGGAWMMGDLDCDDAVCRTLANRAGCAVLSVDYRLAPEHVYPAASDDAFTVTVWAADHFDRLAVGGESSGGNLAAAVAIRARDAGLGLALQLLVCPVIDYVPDSRFYDEYRERYADFAGVRGWGAFYQQAIRWMWEQYVPDPADRVEADAAPMRASSLRELAPTLMITAEHDILRGENEDYARALEAADVPVQIITYPHQIHGFYARPGAFEDGRRALDASGTAVRAAFTAVRRATRP